MECYENPAESLSFSVMGASAAILKANYSIDCFMARYRRVEWLDKKNWGCNQRCSPFLIPAPDCLTACVLGPSCCWGNLRQLQEIGYSSNSRVWGWWNIGRKFGMVRCCGH